MLIVKKKKKTLHLIVTKAPVNNMRTVDVRITEGTITTILSPQ